MLLEVRLKDKQKNNQHRMHIFSISDLIQGCVKDTRYTIRVYGRSP